MTDILHTINVKRQTYILNTYTNTTVDKQTIKQKYKIQTYLYVSISSTLLRTNFSYERRFSSFYYVHATRKAAGTTFVQKICTFNVDEIDTR